MDNSRLMRLSKELEHPCLIEREADLLYLTGQTLSKGRLIVNGEESCLFVDGRYFEKAKKEAPCAVSLWDELKNITDQKIGFDSATVTYQGYLTLKKTLPHVEWLPIPNPVKKIRAIKEPNEIEALRRAAHLTLRGCMKVIELLKEGVTEEELALEFEIFCRRNGASGLSFDPIIAFGENSAYPHYRAGKSRLREGQVVLIDVGAVVDRYHGDLTRIHYFGEPDPRIVRFKHIVKRAQKMAIDCVKPGVKIGELDQIVQDEFDRANVKQLYIHGLGHGVGLEAHEFPGVRFDGADKDLFLEKGMVFTIEPGLYQPGIGGVRLEEMILVTENGHEILM